MIIRTIFRIETTEICKIYGILKIFDIYLFIEYDTFQNNASLRDDNQDKILTHKILKYKFTHKI